MWRAPRPAVLSHERNSVIQTQLRYIRLRALYMDRGPEIGYDVTEAIVKVSVATLSFDHLGLHFEQTIEQTPQNPFYAFNNMFGLDAHCHHHSPFIHQHQ